jgi:hypothetical protein
MTLRSISADNTVHVFDDVFNDGAIENIPVRTTIVRHGDSLVLFSPLGLPDALLDSLLIGIRLVVVIAPNAGHHVFAHSMQSRCVARGVPQVQLISSPALKRRFPDKDWGVVVQHTDNRSAALDVLDDGGSVSVFLVHGLRLDELVLHVPSANLLACCDLAFNFTPQHALGRPWLVRAYMRAIPRASLSLPFFFLIHDAPAMQQSLNHIMQLDFDTLCMAHGDVILDGGKAALRDGTVKFVNNTVAVRGVARRLAIVAFVVGVAVVARKFLN